MASSLGFPTLTPSFLLHKASVPLDAKETYGLARLLARVDRRDVSPEQSRPALLLAQNVLKHLVAMADVAEAAERRRGGGGGGGDGGDGGGGGGGGGGTGGGDGSGSNAGAPASPGLAHSVGVYKPNPVDPSRLSAPAFNP
jgi:uncharacterized membrane protein YgcG